MCTITSSDRMLNRGGEALLLGSCMRPLALLFHRNDLERRRVRGVLGDHFSLLEAGSLDQLTRFVGRRDPRIVVAELLLPTSRGVEMVRWLRRIFPAAEVVMLSPVDAPSFAVAAARAGAFGFVGKHDPDDAILTVAHEAFEHAAAHREGQQVDGLPETRSPTVRAMYRRLLAHTDDGRNLIVFGERGTGRQRIVSALHSSRAPSGVLRFVDSRSQGSNALMTSFNIAGPAAPGSEPAFESTVCLLHAEQLAARDADELGQLCAGPVLTRLGDGSQVPVRHRLVAIMTRGSGDGGQVEAVARLEQPPLNAVCIEVPPLRQRVEDLPALWVNEAVLCARRFGCRPKELADDAAEVLATYGWPGNLPELRNLVERITLTRPSDVVLAEDVPLDIHIHGWRRGLTYRDAVERLEREFLREALQRADGCRRRAAEKLSVPYSTLKFRLRKLGMSNGRDKPPALTEPGGQERKGAGARPTLRGLAER